MNRYDELGGMRDTPVAYAKAIGHDCPTCGVGMGELCVNPQTGKERAAPCVSREKK